MKEFARLGQLLSEMVMMMKNLLSLAMASAVLVSGCANAQGQPEPASAAEANEQSGDIEPAFENFIRRDGATLYDGEQPFRFISFNVPTLNYVEDEMQFDITNPYGLPSEYELRDVFATVSEMGGQVIRGYTIPVRSKDFPPDTVTYVEGPGQFNEEAFRTLDFVIALAGEYRIRLIQPLMSNWPWMGGRPQYAAFRGLDNDAFCTDPQLREDVKATITYVLNRRNTITGIAYKDDPAIMAWETGNEMTCEGEWAVDIAEHIKANAPRQLVVDGYHAVGNPGQPPVFVQQHSIDSDAIDLISTHHYEGDPHLIAKHIAHNLALIDGKKPLFVGEVGFISTDGMEHVLDGIIDAPDIAGAAIWSLRRHHRNGGWYYHTEPLGDGLYRAYHWPGFDGGNIYDERAFMALVRRKGFEIQGLDAPAISPVSPPTMLPFDRPGQIRWQGAMGASGYILERAPSADGPWTQIAYNVDDHVAPGFPIFSDENAPIGQAAFYRVSAMNSAGVSVPSNLVGPVDTSIRTTVDEARNFGSAYHWQGIEVRSGNWRSFKEAPSRLYGTAGSSMTYRAKGSFVEMRVYSFEKGESPLLELAASRDGEKFANVVAATEDYASSEANYDYFVPRLYTLSANADSIASFFRLNFKGEANIVRVEIDYRPLRDQ